MNTEKVRRTGMYAVVVMMMTCAPLAIAIEAIDVEPQGQPPAAFKSSARPWRQAAHSLTAPVVAPIEATGTVLGGAIDGTGKIAGGTINGTGTILSDTVNGIGRFLGGLISLPPKPGKMGDGLVKPVVGTVEGTIEIGSGVVEGTVEIGGGVIEAGVKIVDGATAPFVFAINATVRASGLADRSKPAMETVSVEEGADETAAVDDEMILEEVETREAPVD